MTTIVNIIQSQTIKIKTIYVRLLSDGFQHLYFIIIICKIGIMICKLTLLSTLGSNEMFVLL